MRSLRLFAPALSFALSLFAQTPASRPIVIRAGSLIDTRAGRVLTSQNIVIQGDRIRSVGAGAVPADAEVIDLSAFTVLPGLIDNHTHVLLQGDITAADYDDQL
jgi:imidazolonepropionase-like amidohydrolase